MTGKGLAFGFALLLAGLTCLAQGQVGTFPPGVFQSRAALDAAGGGGGGIAFVQATNGGATASNLTIATSAFGSSVTTGSLIVVAIAFDCGPGGTVVVSSVTDTAVNVYTSAAAKTRDTTQNQCIHHWYKANATGGSSFVVTATFSTATGFTGIVAHEVSGALTTTPLDQIAGTFDVSAAPASGSMTTTTNGQYIFATVNNDGGTGSNTYSAGSGFTEPANGTGTPAANETMSQYQVQSAAGAINPAFVRSASGNNLMLSSTYKAP